MNLLDMAELSQARLALGEIVFVIEENQYVKL